MKLLKSLLLLLALFCSSYCEAQEFESITVDSSTKWPGYAHIRIKFPHDGFRFSRYSSTGPLMLPPLTNVLFFFDECPSGLDGRVVIDNSNTALSRPAANRASAVTYYDTTIEMYIEYQARYLFAVYLNPNYSNPNCVKRSSYVMTDSMRWGYVWSPGPNSIQNAEKGTQVAVYPNPVINHRLKVTAKGNGRIASLTLYSLQGALLVSYLANDTETEINLPGHLPAGNYLLLLQTDNGFVERKLITVQ